jgi:hypothetical protein
LQPSQTAGSAGWQASRIFSPDKTLVPLRSGRMIEPVMADATTIDARPRRCGRQHVTTVTATQLGVHLGITRQRIAALADVEHVIRRLPDGRFDQDDSRWRYLDWLRDPARRSARSEADAQFVAAKSELLRLRVAEKCRDLISRSEVDETLHAIAGIVTRHLGGMAARCTHDLRVRATIDRVVFEVRTEMAIAATKLADARGEPPLDASRD